MHSTTSLFVGVIIQNFNDLKAEKDKERAGGLCVDKQMVNRLCMAIGLGSCPCSGPCSDVGPGSCPRVGAGLGVGGGLIQQNTSKLETL